VKSTARLNDPVEFRELIKEKSPITLAAEMFENAIRVDLGETIRRERIGKRLEIMNNVGFALYVAVERC
jgi:hypothetical protein